MSGHDAVRPARVRAAREVSTTTATSSPSECQAASTASGSSAGSTIGPGRPNPSILPSSPMTAILASEALHSWYLPMVPVHLIASLIVAGFALLNLRGIKYATRAATLIGAASATLALASTVIPVAFGTVDWQRAGSWHLETPFHGAFGALTSTMAGLYLIGFAAPAFEAPAAHAEPTRVAEEAEATAVPGVPEPPPAYVNPLPEAPVDPARPKRTGWWARAKQTLGGG